MLTQMRSLSQNWIGRLLLGVVLGFIILSFAVWGIGDRIRNTGGNFIAVVGDARVSVDDYRNAFQTQLQRIEQSQKRAITTAEARRLGLDRQILSRLLSNAILDQEAEKLGLAVGDEDIRKRIFADPIFKGRDGAFSLPQFKAILANNNTGEKTYIADERADVKRTDVTDAVVGGLEVPKAMAQTFHAYRSEVRDLSYFVLPSDAAGTIPTPTVAELKTYYEDRKTLFSAPEYRKLVVLSIIPANLIKPAAVSDADIAKRYDAMKGERFVTPERRAVEQLLFSDEKRADAAEAKLAGGEAFNQLVADRSEGATDLKLGTMAKSGIGDKAVADAAFALPQGGTTKPIKTKFGWVMMHVDKIVPGHTQALFEVAPELRNEIAIVRAKQQSDKMRQQIEDARTAGKTLTEAAAAVGLKPRTIDAINAQGRGKDNRPIEGLADGPALLKAAFSTGVGEDTEMLATPDGGDVWYEVAGVDAAHTLPFADIGAKVKAMWRGDEVARRLSRKGETLVKAIDGGKSIEKVAAESGGLQIVEARNVARDGTPVLPETAIEAIFDVKAGKAGSAPEPNHGRMVFKVEASRVPPLPAAEPDVAKLKVGLVDDVIAQYLGKAQSEIGVKINQQALANALGGDAGS